MEAPSPAAAPAPSQEASDKEQHPHARLIDRFYTAFANKDWASMADCYHPEAHFSDPVFPALSSTRNSVVAMWRMFCENKTSNLQVTHSHVHVDLDGNVTANWEAKYLIQGNPVHNKIHASFVFRDGKILRHTDQFDLWTWASQALGWTGYLLGWTGFVQSKVRATAAGRLASFIEKNPEYKEPAKL